MHQTCMCVLLACAHGAGCVCMVATRVCVCVRACATCSVRWQYPRHPVRSALHAQLPPLSAVLRSTGASSLHIMFVLASTHTYACPPMPTHFTYASACSYPSMACLLTVRATARMASVCSFVSVCVSHCVCVCAGCHVALLSHVILPRGDAGSQVYVESILASVHDVFRRCTEDAGKVVDSYARRLATLTYCNLGTVAQSVTKLSVGGVWSYVRLISTIIYC